jgi:hypothetical protein
MRCSAHGDDETVPTIERSAGEPRRSQGGDLLLEERRVQAAVIKERGRCATDWFGRCDAGTDALCRATLRKEWPDFHGRRGWRCWRLAPFRARTPRSSPGEPRSACCGRCHSPQPDRRVLLVGRTSSCAAAAPPAQRSRPRTTSRGKRAMSISFAGMAAFVNTSLQPHWLGARPQQRLRDGDGDDGEPVRSCSACRPLARNGPLTSAVRSSRRARRSSS